MDTAIALIIIGIAFGVLARRAWLAFRAPSAKHCGGCGCGGGGPAAPRSAHTPFQPCKTGDDDEK